MADLNIVTLRDVPLIAEIERMMDIRGITWREDFIARCDEVSVALFGLTEAETREDEPTMHSVWLAARHHGSLTEREQYSLKHEGMYNEAYQDWAEIERTLAFFDGPLDQAEPLMATGSVVIDVRGEDGAPLRCLKMFGRQLAAAANECIEGARLTLDGSGKALAVEDDGDLDQWAANLAADAAKFKPSRR